MSEDEGFLNRFAKDVKTFFSAGPGSGMEKAVHSIANIGIAIGESSSTTAASVPVTNIFTDLDDFLTALWAVPEETPLEIMAKGMNAAVFAAGRHDQLRNSQAAKTADGNIFGVNAAVQFFKRITSLIVNRADHLLKVSAAVKVVGSALYILPGASAFIRAGGEVGVGVAEVIRTRQNNKLMEKLVDATAIAFPTRRKKDPKALNLIKEALIAGKAGGNAAAAVGMDTAMFAINTPASMAIVAGGRIAAALAEDFTNRIENWQLNEIVMRIDSNISLQSCAARNRLVHLTGLERMMRPIIGLVALAFTGIRAWYSTFAEYIQKEADENRKNARIFATTSISCAYHTGIERRIVSQLIEKEGKTYLKKRPYESDLRFLIRIREEKLKHHCCLDEGESLKTEAVIAKEILQAKAQIEATHETSTPYRDILRVLIAMAEDGLLIEGKKKEDFYEKMRLLDPEPVNWPIEQLKPLFEFFKNADAAEFIMESNIKPDAYGGETNSKNDGKNNVKKDDQNKIDKEDEKKVKDPETKRDDYWEENMKKAARGILIHYNAAAFPQWLEADFRQKLEKGKIEPDIST